MKPHNMAIAAATILLCACGHTYDTTDHGFSLHEPVELTVYANIADGTSSRVNGVNWEPNAAIGISKTDGINSKYTLTGNASTPNGTFQAEEGKGIKIENNITLTAYYPYRDKLTDDAFIIDLFKQTENIDLMTAQAAAVIGNGEATATFNFRHQLSKIKITVTNEVGLEYFGAENMEITLNNQRTKAVYNVAQNTVDIVKGSEANGTITLVDANGDEGKVQAEAILLPNDLESNPAVTDNRLITFNIGGKIYIYSIPQSHSYRTGKIAKYDIAIKSPTEISVSATIEDWVTDKDVNGGKPIEGEAE